MPNIPTYESPIDKLTPDERGPAALNAAAGKRAYAAYRIQNFADRAGAKIGEGIREIGAAAQDFETEHQGFAELGMAGALAATTKEKIQRMVFDAYNAADPNDTSVHDKTLNAVNDVISQSGDNFKTEPGQKHWTGEQGELYRYSSGLIAGLDGQRAFAAEVNNFKTTLNSAAAAIDNDPSEANLKDSLRMLERNGRASLANRPFLSGEGGAKALELYTDSGPRELVKHYMIGQAEKDPDFQTKLDKGAYDEWKRWLSPEEQNDLPKRAATAAKARIETQNQQIELQRKQAKDQVDKLSTEALTQFVAYDQNTGRLTVDPRFNRRVLDIGKIMAPGPDGTPAPIANPSELRTMFELGRAIRQDATRDDISTDPQTYDDFRARAFLSPDDPTRLTDEEIARARIDRKLSDKDYARLAQAVNVVARDPRQVAQQRQFDQFFAAYKGFVTKSTAMNPQPEGDARAFQMRQYLEDQYAAGLAMGKSPTALLAYNGPEGILNDGVIKRFQPTLSQATESMSTTGGMLPAPNPNVRSPNYGSVPAWSGESMGELFRSLPINAAPSPGDLAKLKKAMEGGQ